MKLEGACTHIRSLEGVAQPKRRECEDCVKVGGEWVHLRTCQSCGGTRCCDSSPTGTPAVMPAGAGHPVIASAEPGERWLYCFGDDLGVEY